MRTGRLPTSGFSVVEVLLAAAIFGLLVTALVGAFLYGQESSALAGARGRASMLADEGLEASRSIRDSAFANLVDGAHGLTQSGSVWTYSGTQDVSGPFTRSVTVSTVDANTKQVASTVTWQQNAQRTGTVTATTYLANWAQSASAVINALLLYGIGTTTPQYRTHDSSANTFSAEQATTAGASGLQFTVRTSPTKNEAIAGYVTATGTLQVMCYNGSAWQNEWSVSVGGTGTTKRFDLAYETNSGDAIVLYSQNVGTTNELGYRTKAGSTGCGAANWSGATNLNPARTTGIVQWVKLAWDKRTSSNLITAIWADANSDLSAMVWSGTAWGNEPGTATETSLEVVAAAQDIDDFDVQYESVSGDVMVVWANSAGKNNTNGVRYRTCTGGTSTCTWGAVTTPPTLSDDATNLSLAASPDTDEMVFASIGDAAHDLQLGYWSGSVWTNTANADTSCNVPDAGTELVATGWVKTGATRRSIVVYGDQGSTSLDWYIGNGSTFSKQVDFPTTPGLANKTWYTIDQGPLSTDRLMVVMSNDANSLSAKRLVISAGPTFTWTDADGGTLLTSSLPSGYVSPFGFAYRRF